MVAIRCTFGSIPSCHKRIPRHGRFNLYTVLLTYYKDKKVVSPATRRCSTLRRSEVDKKGKQPMNPATRSVQRSGHCQWQSNRSGSTNGPEHAWHRQGIEDGTSPSHTHLCRVVVVMPALS